MYADLHLHSVFSDGTDTPDELITLAKSNGIKVVSITDHDSISAYKRLTIINDSEIKIIPAIEISTVLYHNYLHILGALAIDILLAKRIPEGCDFLCPLEVHRRRYISEKIQIEFLVNCFGEIPKCFLNFLENTN